MTDTVWRTPCESASACIQITDLPGPPARVGIRAPISGPHAIVIATRAELEAFALAIADEIRTRKATR